MGSNLKFLHFRRVHIPFRCIFLYLVNTHYWVLLSSMMPMTSSGPVQRQIHLMSQFSVAALHSMSVLLGLLDWFLSVVISIVDCIRVKLVRKSKTSCSSYLRAVALEYAGTSTVVGALPQRNTKNLNIFMDRKHS